MCLGCHKHKTSTRGSTKAVIGEVNPEQSAAMDTGKAHHRVGFQQFFFFFFFLFLTLMEGDMPVPQKQFLGKALVLENSTEFLAKYS